MSFVLVIYYLVEKNFFWVIIGNEFLLMSIGVGLVLLVNFYMFDIEKCLRED